MSTEDELEDKLDALAEEFSARVRDGAAPDIEAYAEANPELAERIRHLFPVLVAMEGAGAAAADAHPEQIGPYAVVRVLGKGGMGVVYEGRDDEGTSVAIKLVHPHLLGDRDYYRRFLREAEAGMRLRHPGIVRTLELGWMGDKDAPRPYLVLEYVEGEDLYSALSRGGPMSERLVRLVGRDVARALAAVHEAGLLHRDVKPENVLITPDETIKLMDMGVALQREGVTRLSVTGQFVGSRLYAAPEQLLGGALDERTDLYALGLVLYELLTEHHPWLAPSGEAVDPSARRGALPRVRDSLPQISRFMDAVVARLLQTEPRDRFDSAAEVATILTEGEDSAWWQETGQAEATGEAAFQAPEPHVGRDAELRRLDGFLARAAEGRGGAVVLSGEMGIGRTHLLRTWLARAAQGRHHPRFVVAGSTSAQQVAPSLAGALGEHLGPANLERRLSTLLSDVAPLVSPFADVLRGLDSDAARTLTVDARSTAFVEVLRGLAADGPVIVAYDDLAQASAEEQQTFVRLALAARKAPLVVVGIVPSEIPMPLDAQARAGAIDRLDVEPLPTDDARALLRACTSDEQVAEHRLDAAAERAGGNPLYLIELARTLGDDERPELPDSLQRAVEAHLSGLDDAARELLDAAACAGQRFDPIWVADALGRPRIAALRALDDVVRAHGVIEPAGRLYRFSHRLAREALLARMHPALAATLHEALAACVVDADAEAKYGLPGPRAVVIGRHYLAAGDAKRVAPYLDDALEPLERVNPSELVELVTAVLDTDADIAPDLRIRALCTKGRALLTLSRRDEAESVSAAAAAVVGGSAGARVALLALQGRIARVGGRLEEAHAYYEDAAAGAAAEGDRRSEARHRIAAAVILGNLGRTAEAQEALIAARAQVDATGARGPVASATISLANLQVESGDLEAAEATLREGLELCRQAGSRRDASRGTAALAGVLHRQGRLAEALEQLETSLGIGLEIGDRKHEVIVRGNLSMTLLELGRVEDATRQAEEAVRLAVESNQTVAAAFAKSQLGHMRAHTGDLDGGMELMEEAVAEARAMAYRSLIRATVGTLLSALTTAGRLDAARAELADMAERYSSDADAVWAAEAAGFEARLLEAEGRFDEALPRHQRALEGATSSADSLWAHVGIARCALRLERRELAREHLGHVRSAPDVGISAAGVLAVALYCHLEADEVETAELTLDVRGAALPIGDQVEAWLALYETGNKTPHLERAVALLARMRDNLREDRRNAFDATDLARRVRAATA